MGCSLDHVHKETTSVFQVPGLCGMSRSTMPEHFCEYCVQCLVFMLCGCNPARNGETTVTAPRLHNYCNCTSRRDRVPEIATHAPSVCDLETVHQREKERSKEERWSTVRRHLTSPLHLPRRPSPSPHEREAIARSVSILLRPHAAGLQ